MRTKNALILLVGVIPAIYVVVAYVVAATTDVFKPETRPKFAALYGLLAAVAGAADYYRLRYDQETRVWVASSPFVRAVIRGHLVTLLLIWLGAGAAFLLDIDTGWPVVLGFMCGPVTGRALALFRDYTLQAVGQVDILVAEIGSSLVVLYLVLALVRGR